jgi:hypothetical protein
VSADSRLSAAHSLLVGVDPGLSGAVVLLDADTLALVDGYSIPAGHGQVLVPDLLDLLDQLSPIVVSQVVIEQVASRPGQGVSSVFTFGRAYGFSRLVSPRDYQTAVPVQRIDVRARDCAEVVGVVRRNHTSGKPSRTT